MKFTSGCKKIYIGHIMQRKCLIFGEIHFNLNGSKSRDLNNFTKSEIRRPGEKASIANAMHMKCPPIKQGAMDRSFLLDTARHVSSYRNLLRALVLLVSVHMKKDLPDVLGGAFFLP